MNTQFKYYACIYTELKKCSRQFLYFLVTIALLSVAPLNVNAQEIDFGSFGNGAYSIEIPIIPEDIFVEESLEINSGSFKIPLEEAIIVPIKGIKYLDVGVTITASAKLETDDCDGSSSCQIDFFLEAGYLNQGAGNQNPNDSIVVTIMRDSNENFGVARFQLLHRQSLPPGPPPPPPTDAFEQNPDIEETAYLFLYGEIVVGDVVSGFYRGSIIVDVRYDAPVGNN